MVLTAMKETKDIEQLLERYRQCLTSPEEEACLRHFFTANEVPAHLMRYKAWFMYIEEQRAETLDETFDARVLAEVEAPVVRARRITLMSRLLPLLKAVAVVALLLASGDVLKHSLLPAAKEVAIAADTISRQITAPSVALSGETLPAARDCTLSDSLNSMKREVVEDSLKQ
jgi:hypothetical protein